MPFNTVKAHTIHNNKYDYSKVQYTGVRNKVEIICPIHGSFMQTPKNHIYARTGCKLCANARITHQFDHERAHRIHNNQYDYSKVQYVNTDTKVEIICPMHGSFFQTPYKHINTGNACPTCGSLRSKQLQSLSTDEFIKRAFVVHGNRYNYNLVEYSNSHTKVNIGCSKHGIFSQSPTNHISGNGCPICSNNTSSTGNKWLDAFDNPNIIREHIMYIQGNKYKVDGYDPSTNTIYEYFGVFWHGCPTYVDHTKINPRNKIPFKTLYDNTLRRIDIIKAAGYSLVYQWGL